MHEPGGAVQADARTVAAAAAEGAGVTLTPARDHDDAVSVAALFDRVWGRTAGQGSLLAAETLTALRLAGNPVTLARRGADHVLVGASAGFLGRDDDGTVFLHSDVTAVRTESAGAGVGRALKWEQRAWCLDRGLTEVRWTFDPLIRRNAVLNLVVLGARATAYAPDVYGTLPDARNAGQPTDRFVVRWELTAPRVLAAAAGRAAAPDPSALRRAGAQVVLAVDGDGAPSTAEPAAPRLLAQTPADIEVLRAQDPVRAAAWSAAARDVLGGALAAGWRVTGISRDGWYVLSADRGAADLRGRP